MAVKSKTTLGRVEHVEARPKRTKQGNSKRSKARHNKKLRRGQGR